MRRFERPEQLPPALRNLRTYLSEGACVTYEFAFDGDANASAMVALDGALAFQSRAALVARGRRQFRTLAVRNRRAAVHGRAGMSDLATAASVLAASVPGILLWIVAGAALGLSITMLSLRLLGIAESTGLFEVFGYGGLLASSVLVLRVVAAVARDGTI